MSAGIRDRKKRPAMTKIIPLERPKADVVCRLCAAPMKDQEPFGAADEYWHPPNGCRLGGTYPVAKDLRGFVRKRERRNAKRLGREVMTR